MSASHDTIFRPSIFAQIFERLRHVRDLTVADLSRQVHYDRSAIEILESRTHNPTLKTLFRYAVGLGIEIHLGPQGITIIDPKTQDVIVKDWQYECF